MKILKKARIPNYIAKKYIHVKLVILVMLYHSIFLFRRISGKLLFMEEVIGLGNQALLPKINSYQKLGWFYDERPILLTAGSLKRNRNYSFFFKSLSLHEEQKQVNN